MPIVGDVLADRYRIESRLGAGGMASVWRARDLRLDRDVAVKILLPNLAADPTLADRFDREARSLAAAAHPSVIAVFDVDPGDAATGREPFYVMELAEGGSLADRLAPTGRMAPDELVPIIGAVADGLAELHRRGMVHRDVKPHNIVFAGGRPKLADFGLARSGEPTELTALTQTGTAVGTLAYLAPELLAGRPATPASDVYALGVAAFQALTGRLPRPSASVTEIVESRALPATTLSAAAPELGSAFDAPLAAALAVDPDARPSPAELAAALAAALAGAPALAGVPALGAGQLGAAAGPSGQPRAAPGLTAGVAAGQPAAAAGPTGLAAGPVAPGASAPSDATAVQRLPPDTRGRNRPALVALAAFGVVVAILLAAGALLRPTGPGPDATQPGGAARSPTTRPAATPPAASQPVQTLAPTRTPLPDGETFAALEEVYDRIDDAFAAGMDTGDADRLRRSAEAVQGFVERGDLRQARNRAERLVQETDDVEDALPDALADPLLRAVEALRDSLPD